MRLTDVYGEVIPQIGVWIGRVPLLGVAALQGWQTFVLTLLVSVVLENLKAFVISPRVEGEQLKIDPLLVLIAVLVGATLLGAGGALIAVPFAAMLQVLEAQEKELAQLEQETDAWVTSDVAAVNRQAAAAGVQFIGVK